jgi:hypothetical protein
MQTAVCLIDAGRDQKNKIDILEAMHYTVSVMGRPSNFVFEKLATGVDNHQMLVT